jgi:hypothetical protein
MYRYGRGQSIGSVEWRSWEVIIAHVPPDTCLSSFRFRSF